ncbi:MAG: hypothetical protein ABWZ91_08680 [Nocardioides sp.]
MNPDRSAGPDELLDGLAEELTARGLAEQGDFYVTGRFPDQVPSSEHIGIRYADGQFRVWYRDMGSSRTLVETDDFDAARERFVAESVALARGRGRKVAGV